MAKYVKKRSFSKGNGRVYKKKTARRSKKVVGQSTKVKSLVATEVAKVLRAGVQNEKRKVTLEMRVPQNQVFINGKDALNNCIRVPVTEAIPAMEGSGQPADVRRRRANKVMVTGVNVRVYLSVSDETRVMAFVHEPHDSVRAHLTAVPLGTVPSAQQGLVPEAFETAMVPYYTTGIVSKHGPLMVKKAGTSVALDSVDDTPFESKLALHGGRPIGQLQSGGSVYKKKFGGGALRRTLNWDQSGNKSVGPGYIAWSTHAVNEYWKLNKVYSYMYEGSNDQVFERPAEIMLYVDCPSLQKMQIDGAEVEGGKALVGAVIMKVVVDVYFHDM